MKHLHKLLALTLIVSACTEKRDFEEIYKGDLSLQLKSDVCNGEEYLYLPSTVEASRTTSATRPHWMGDAKIVKIQCEEHALKVVEVDSEDKLADNPVNNLPVLSIPVEYKDYKCSQDADGKCTQKEEENNDISWKQKRFVQIQADQMKIQEVNMLPEQLENLFTPCYTSTSENLIKSKFEKDAINIILERSYQTSIDCADGLRELADLGFRVRYHYSLVKLDSLTTPNYQAMEYPRSEEGTFGFFNTQSDKLDVDNNETQDGEKVFVNRWAPNQVVKYHLSEAFLKDENQSLFTATKHAVESINNTLKAAGAELAIELVDPTPDLDTGDLRVNSIVLEDDPLAMSVIGYGPTAANPKTGEIVHGRTVMYLGSIRKYIKNTYDEFVLQKKAEEENSKTLKNIGNQSNFTLSAALQAESSQAIETLKSVSSEKLVALMSDNKFAAKQFSALQSLDPSNAKFTLNDKLIKDRVTNPLNHKMSRKDLLFDAHEGHDNHGEISDIKADFLFSKNCYYTADMLEFNSSIEDEIAKLVEELGLKSWLELSTTEKQKVLDVVTPFVWVPVLVHELGHNLGLRHNFAGSEDKANFYSADELKKMGVTRPIAYSSVMDYSYSTINELPVMGKYDIAALRYGYAEKVELNDSSIISLAKFRAEGGELKDYKFCTDEHVSVNPNCNRFDEGTNLTEIAQHHIRAYEESYAKNNFRNGRRSFSLMDDASYISRLGRTLGSLRNIFERYESIKNEFGIEDSNPIWESNDFLKDLKQATLVAGKFFIKVLKTPDLMCAVAAKANPTQILGLLPIVQLSPFAVDCFDSENVQLNDKYMVVGKAGKLFQSRKDRRNGNPYVDQIDVRGIWIDKLIALNALTQRKIGISTFDKYLNNYLDIADFSAEADQALRELVMDQTVADVELELINGQKLTAQLPVKMYDKLEAKNGHRIVEPLSRRVSRAMDLVPGHPTFQEMVLHRLHKTLASQSQITDSSSLLNAITIGKAKLTDTVPGNGVVKTSVGQTIFYAPVTNNVAAAQIQLKSVVTLLEKVGAEKVKEIASKKAKGEKLDEKASKEEKDAYDLPSEILEAFTGGQLQDKEFYEMILLAM